jgi:hypothetical protein
MQKQPVGRDTQTGSGPQQPHRQSIPPYEQDQYSDIFWASLYGTLCQFGMNETRLIWLRSSAMLIAHSFILNLAVGQSLSGPDERRPFALGLAVIGLLLTCCWCVLNFHGWRNQDHYYWFAARLQFTGINVPLTTDFWGSRTPPRPSGTVYWIAQLISVIFFLVYLAILGFALSSLTRLCIALVLVIAAAVAGCAGVFLCCRSLLKGEPGTTDLR